MKKLKIWSMMMLMVMAMPLMMACGGDDSGNNDNNLSPEFERLCKLANIKTENYDWWTTNEKLYADSTYIPFAAHEKNSDNFYIWILDKSYNQYFTYKGVIKHKIDYSLGYGESIEMFFDSLSSRLTILSSKTSLGWLVYLKYSYNSIPNNSEAVGGSGNRTAYFGNIIGISKKGSSKLIYELNPTFDGHSDVLIHPWYNNSVAFEISGNYGYVICDQNYSLIKKVYLLEIDENHNYIEKYSNRFDKGEWVTAAIQVEGLIELTDYDKAIYWKTQCYDGWRKWVGLSEIFIDLVDLNEYIYKPIATTEIKLPDMGEEEVKYSLEVISSDSKKLNVRITLVSYSGKKEIIDATIDKQELYDKASVSQG